MKTEENPFWGFPTLPSTTYQAHHRSALSGCQQGSQKKQKTIFPQRILQQIGASRAFV